MHRHLHCTCGRVIDAATDDELVRKMQDHMKQEHRKDISREEVLRMAHGAH